MIVVLLKTKLRSTCEKYSKIKVTYQYQNAINELSRESITVFLKQIKTRGLVILDATKYTEKCLTLLNTEQFKKLTTNPTGTTEKKIEKALKIYIETFIAII